MSLVAIISKIEEERSLNRTLLKSLLQRLDGDIQRIEEQKQSLVEEFAERDASLLRLIEGEAKAASAPVAEAA